MKKVYIQSVASISAQKTFEKDYFLEEIEDYEANVINVINPVYKDYIPPAAARRMAKGIKMGVVASKIALHDAGLESVDAVITGTGMGCVRDSEKFVSAIIDNDEQYLTPTSFIQSTHNTVGGQIALELQCKGYNFTYVHASNSFESALFDAKLQLELNEEKNILIGGVDELGDHTTKINKLINHIKAEAVKSSELLVSNTTGAVYGEGANFFVLSNEKKDTCYAELASVKMFNTLAEEEVLQEFKLFLKENNLKVEDIDLLVLGNNGDIEFDGYYNNLSKEFNNTQQAYYKHLCGEFHTASSFAFWLASKVLKIQSLPEVAKLNQKTIATYKTVLLYNQYRGENHSFTLLKKC
ncbi:beta-ketoacyl synthase N-terminal-like domain-containing protein [Oceanihabitans sediminis]|uniref:3-oxoacyl-ACP synthase n=1 Tax=Oceanihabitans sediminis TaxID=1812012 RepID=A0A368PAR3_9FLAO|nr:beta-ketoacyl synthase N-terminal-like domain-containing protein [Oceanihabitans sediminis]MDX1278643.1 beta-ketoacyl synthase N-terminal-like domain-containing protein [Oceanihabitans sediminis]MDX1772871.1 beta-ketoacyl synthase N-terminal-like domain-containing protein [Oceanihabitans sediminis]RCU58909.1 3-oxoacyl-ACP synthase [Oceanihabitans sediminis]